MIRVGSDPQSDNSGPRSRFLTSVPLCLSQAKRRTLLIDHLVVSLGLVRESHHIVLILGFLLGILLVLDSVSPVVETGLLRLVHNLGLAVV